MRSMSSSFRVRTRERGYVLIAAITIAILYFALMELMLIDSSRALREAQRFRSKVVAATLAESAAELSAASMVTRNAGDTINADDEQGSMKATCKVNGDGVQYRCRGDDERRVAGEVVGARAGKDRRAARDDRLHVSLAVAPPPERRYASLRYALRPRIMPRPMATAARPPRTLPGWLSRRRAPSRPSR